MGMGLEFVGMLVPLVVVCWYVGNQIIPGLRLGSNVDSFWGFQGRTWGGYPLTHHLAGDFGHGNIMRPVNPGRNWRRILQGGRRLSCESGDGT